MEHFMAPRFWSDILNVIHAVFIIYFNNILNIWQYISFIILNIISLIISLTHFAILSSFSIFFLILSYSLNLPPNFIYFMVGDTVFLISYRQKSLSLSSPPHTGKKFRLNSWIIYQGYKILSTWGGYSGQVLWSIFIRLLNMYVRWAAGYVMNQENNGEDRSRYKILGVICIWIIFELWN